MELNRSNSAIHYGKPSQNKKAMDQINSKEKMISEIFENGIISWEKLADGDEGFNPYQNRIFYQHKKKKITASRSLYHMRAWTFTAVFDDGYQKTFATVWKQTQDPKFDLQSALAQSNNAEIAKKRLMQYAMKIGMQENIPLIWNPQKSQITAYANPFSPNFRYEIHKNMNARLIHMAAGGALKNEIETKILSANLAIVFKIPSSAHEKMRILEETAEI